MKNVKTSLVSFSVILTLACLFSSCSSSVGTQDRETSDYARSETAEERRVSQRMVQLTNAHRAKLGLSTLAPGSYIKSLAMEHSLFIAKKHRGTSSIKSFAHAGVWQRAKVLREKKSRTLGENVAWHNARSSDAADRLFNTLLKSKAHRKAIEQKNWKKMGISVVRGSNGTFYATQLFTRPYIKPAPIPQMIFL